MQLDHGDVNLLVHYEPLFLGTSAAHAALPLLALVVHRDEGLELEALEVSAGHATCRGNKPLASDLKHTGCR